VTTGVILHAIPIASFGLGIGYCFHSILFRWSPIRNKYGRFGLYWWIGAVMFAAWLAGSAVAITVWLVQRQISN
jgi:hypothetical protein